LVTATSRSAAKVMLLIDRQSAVDAVVQRSRSRGIVRGAHGDDLIFEFVVRDGDVQQGDVLVTSGLGGVYPKGIRIGEVSSVSASDSKMLRTAAVRPAVDFGRLEQVFVMLRRGPTMELLYATDEGDSADPAERARP
jgi:rod shape-determining protein MreC